MIKEEIIKILDSFVENYRVGSGDGGYWDGKAIPEEEIPKLAQQLTDKFLGR